MRAEAEAVVKAGAPDARLVETRTADMRYRGQGHEITVSLPAGRLRHAPRATTLMKLYEDGYATTFGRTIPGLDVEIMNWTLRLAAEQAAAGRGARRSRPTSRPSRAARGRSTTRPIRT